MWPPDASAVPVLVPRAPRLPASIAPYVIDAAPGPPDPGVPPWLIALWLFAWMLAGALGWHIGGLVFR